MAEELVERAVALAKEKGIDRITRVRVSLGEVSHVSGEAFSFWFGLVKGDTIARQAVLEIARAKGDGLVMLFLEGEGADASGS